MTINFHQLLSRTYLIDIDPVTLHPTDKGLLILGGALVILGIIFRMLSLFGTNQFARKIWRRLSTWGLTIGLLEVLWFGLRYERALYLGSHMIAFLILLIGLIWLIPIIKYTVGQYRRDIAGWQKEQLKQKYLQR